MDIAVIGWGSVVWNPGSLDLASLWHKDGPELPIEFARLSGNGTITLVVTHIWGTPVRTYWAKSGKTCMDKARLDLQARERTPDIANIGGVTASGEIFGRVRFEQVGQMIYPWLLDRNLQGAVWTGLREKALEQLTDEDRIEWVEGLPVDADSQIELYVRRAPLQVRTPVREWFTEQFGWDAIPVPAESFVDCTAEAYE